MKNDSYTFEGKEYQLTRHGFARDNDFEIIHQTENEVVLSFKSNEETVKIYPFQFELQLGYLLTNDELVVSYTVINTTEDKTILFSIGAHPAFAIDNSFSDYSLVFDNDFSFESHLLENDLFSGKTKSIVSNENKIALNYELFKDDALVFKNLKSTEVSLHYKDKPHLKMNFEGFPYFGIWTKENALFLCLEPWFGHADETITTGDLAIKKGIININSDEIFSSNYKIKLL
ncbi:MAG: aldose 1-epimerase family protein [Flavobacterium sp.]|nr:aldose 1-epimerase family protein [Flavobacterium sp.]